MYCRTYYTSIPLHSYLLIGNLSDFSASVADSFKWYFIFMPLITLAGGIIYYLKIARKGKRTPNPKIYYPLYVLFLFGAILLFDIKEGGTLHKLKILSDSCNLKGVVVPLYTLGGVWVNEYIKSAEPFSPTLQKEVENWLSQQEKLTLPYWNDSIRKKRKHPENLVIVLCESLESWVVGKKIEGKEVTPYLNRLLEDSTTFYAPNVLTQVGAGRSIEGQLLITTGMLPMYNKVYAYEAVDDRFFSLPKAFREEGGKSVLFTCDKPYVWNQYPVSRAFGWEKLVHHDDFRNDELIGEFRLLSDGSLMQQVTDKLSNENYWEEGEKALIMVVTYSGHNPFKLPEHLKKIRLNGKYPEVISNYINCANYTDSAIEKFIEYLKTRQDWENTMVMITGDHEGLAADRKTALANVNSSEFVDPNQHTPLIILNSPVAGLYESELGQVDIYPTLLDLMGLDKYVWRGLGRSIFDPGKPKLAISTDNNIVGETLSVDSLEMKHIKDARDISDIILKFNLLRHYPDSVSIN